MAPIQVQVITNCGSNTSSSDRVAKEELVIQIFCPKSLMLKREGALQHGERSYEKD